MKKISIACLTSLLFFTACENTNSSTVGTYEKEETSQSSEKSESEHPGAEVKEKAGSAATDTLKTSIYSAHEGVEKKPGTNGSVDTTTIKP